MLILTGPTGTGKTDWAAEAASTLPLEIISVDSALVYRGLDIGTAKPSRELRARIPHHLVDLCDPAESYSAGRFVTDTLACIADIHARRKIPLLVGGTMLYLRALRQGIAELPEASPEIRRTLDERAAREGWPALHTELARLDPIAAARIHPNDPQRIQRALEVCYASGRSLTELQRETHSPLADATVHEWALVPEDRSAYRQRLEQRFHAMMQAGFLDEVARLKKRADLTAHHPSMRAVGYRQLWAYLDGKSSRDEAIGRGIAATGQLAKRQLTWLRSERKARPEIAWLDVQKPGAFDAWRRQLETVQPSARAVTKNA